MHFIILLLFCFTSNIIALKIYQSNISYQDENVVSGLYYKKEIEQNVIFSQSLTTCVRFNFKRLRDSSRIIVIRNSNSQIYPDFLRMYARYPQTWINFGNHEHGIGSKASWILRDPATNSYLIWRTNKWHHICFSYSKSNSFVSFVKVRYNARPNQIELESGRANLAMAKKVTISKKSTIFLLSS